MHTTSYYIRDDCPPEPKARVYISVEDKIGFINEYDTLLFTWIVKKLNSDFVSKCLRGLKFYCSSKNNDLCLFLRKGNSGNISSRMYLTFHYSPQPITYPHFFHVFKTIVMLYTHFAQQHLLKISQDRLRF